MKDLRDGFLYEYLPKVSKLMDDELERNISKDDFPAELDQKIYFLIEKEARKRFYIPKVAVIFICIISMTTITIAVDAASGGKIYAVIKEFFGAAEVTDENRNMIGKEIINDTPIEAHYEKDWEKEISYAPEIPIPTSINGFAVDSEKTPEIIILNAGCALFHQDEYNGWNCKEGDVLQFEFEKYESMLDVSQSIYIGYVLDGVMYEGEFYDEPKGCYQLEIEQEGEYYIYVFNVSSDSVTLKEGKIS